MSNIIACNLGSYRQFCDAAWEHLPSIGIRNIETQIPAPDDAPALLQKLQDHGLAASTLMARCPMSADDCVEQFVAQLDVAKEFETKIIFTSVKAGDVPLDTAYGRMREIGDAAAERGMKVAMETHPDLIQNGDLARTTMQGIAHPNVGVNFDTANIHYYNENVDGVTELTKIISHLHSVHLKDTNGGYNTHYFPTLGQGVVKFPEIFALCAAHGFSGPFTMELEGIKDEHLDQQGVLCQVAGSVAYLRSIGAAE